MEEFNRTISNVKMYESPNLHLEVTAKCCARCVFCGYRYIKRKKGEMSRELISKILDELAGWEKPMKEIVPVHYGEFFLRKDWFEILKEIEEKLPNTSIAIPTNGYPLEIDDAAKLAQISTLKYLSFSVYAFFDETYERLIGLPAENMEKISKLINVLMPLRNDLRIAVGTTNTPPFMTDYENGLFKERWKDLAQTHVIIANKQINPELQKTFPYPISCFTIFGSMAILWDGKAVACCFDPNGELEVGDACKEKVLDIWRGERMKELQRKHMEGLRDEIELCKSCTFGGAFVGEVNGKKY